MIASIAVSSAIYAIDKPYSYRVPDEMTVSAGMRVIVPFGRGNRRSEGIVLEVKNADGPGLKTVEQVLDQEPVVSEAFLRLAAFLRERYFCTYYDAVKTILPVGVWFDAAQTYVLGKKRGRAKLSDDENAMLACIEDHGGRMSKAELRKFFCSEEEQLEQSLTDLKKKGFLKTELDFSRKLQDKTEKIVSLAVPAEEAMEYALRHQNSAALQSELLRLLCTVGTGSAKEICYLTGASRQTVNRLEKLGYVTVSTCEVFRSPLPDFVEPAQPLVLSQKQQEVYRALRAQNLQDKPGISLLYGVTGSGKTSVYIQLILDALADGKSAILLVPEIALTPQLIRLLMSYFGETVAVLHSGLRVSERYDEWKRIRKGEAKVVIGTRSAVFAPVRDLGILIVDEEQEHTYKSENSPRYHAREVAVYRGAKEGALVLLGSATPSIESMTMAKQGVYTLHCLPERYNGKSLPEVEIIDMKQEIRAGNAMSISRSMQEALRQNLAQGRQSILFLNRRGAGRCVVCVNCGNVPSCPRCSISLTYHKANGRLMCHYCGFSEPVSVRCPQCGGAVKIIGTGTQKVEQELGELFPGTQVLRMDADTVSASNTHEMILNRFQEEKIPILIGTQMVTKGLNFENVTLVGIIDADMSLYINHYRAAETTFSMLTQVIGRAGRGAYTGRAMIQTMTPAHSVIRMAAGQDYDSFYEKETALRQNRLLPPFGDLFSVMFTGIFENDVRKAAKRFRDRLCSTNCSERLQILGPSPAAIVKINNTYRYCLTVCCKNNRAIRLHIADLLKEFAKDKINKGVSVYADVNAYE